MSDFKSEYKRAVDRLEPDGRLLESLKADMKAAKNAPPKPNFFVKYGWVFGSAAACLAVVLAVSVFFVLGKTEMSSGGAAMPSAADKVGAAELVQAPSMNGGIYAPENDAEDAGDGRNADDENVVFEPSDGEAPDDAYADSAAPEQEAEDLTMTPAGTTRTSGEAFENAAEISADDDRTEYYAMPYIEPLQVGALKSLSYKELDALMVTDRSERQLILSDFMLYDYVEIVKDNVNYLVLRYNTFGFILPVVAAFEGMSPSDPIVSLRLYKDYEDPSAYIDLREISLENLEDYFPRWGYIYNFNGDDVAFNEDDLEQLTPMTDVQFFELMNKVNRGSLCLRDFEEFEFFDVGFSSYTYTFVCIFTYSATEQEYVLITHFPGTEYDTIPDRMVLVKRRSMKELDLLSEYEELGRFMA